MSTTAGHSTAFRFARRPWAIPAVVATAVVATAVAVPLIADADSDLPERSAAELVSGLVDAKDVPFAGTIVHSADLGLPDLPALTGDESSPWALLSGATTARVWYTDSSSFRVALQGELSEIDLIRDGEDFWYWDSEENVVTHETAPKGTAQPDEKALNPGEMLSNTAMAEMALGLVEPSTDVQVDGTGTVAGRAVYELVIRPKDEQSLIGSVRVAIDGEHGLPLRVQVFGTDGGDPAIEIGFTSVSFAEPDPSVYEFTPPPGATVEELDAGSWLGQLRRDGQSGTMPGMPLDGMDDVSVEVAGEGWTSVLVISGVRMDDVTARLEELTGGVSDHVGDVSAIIDAFLGDMQEVNGSYGSGVGMQSELLSILWLEDGRLLVGAVSLEALEEAAS